MTLLRWAAQSDSFWFTINGETCWGISLCRRLGFFDDVSTYYAFLVTAGLAGYDFPKNNSSDDEVNKELKIYKKEWISMLAHDAIQSDGDDLFEISMMRFDV